MKKFAKIISAAAIIAVFIYMIKLLLPISYEKVIDNNINNLSDSSILYESQDITMGDDTAKVIAFSNGEEYTYMVMNKTDGLLNNQCTISKIYTHALPSLTNDVENYQIKTDVSSTKDKNDGIYIGIVPSTCKSLTFDGKKAQLIKQTANYNGNEYKFYLYILKTEYKENPHTVYTDIYNVKTVI